MTTSPARGTLASFRLGVSHAGNSDYAALSVSPRRQSRRPAVSDEGIRHCEDVPLPSWSVSPQRTVSPSSHHHNHYHHSHNPSNSNGSNRSRGGATLAASALLESGPLLSGGPDIASNLSCSSPLTPSANGTLVHLPASAFEDPDSWSREHAQLRSRFLRPGDAVTIYHDYTAALNCRATMRHLCVVHPLPRLERVQEALRKRCVPQTVASAYDAFEQRCLPCGVEEETASVAQLANGEAAVQRGAHREQRTEALVPASRLWCVSGSTYNNEIVVSAATTGQRLLRVVDPKMKVAVTALQHAPFRGFMEAQQLQVLPVKEPQDVLRLKASQLVFTDYVWCGLQDGTLRLLPACQHHIRAGGPSAPYSKSSSADLVYELPRYQGGAIVSIVCSPCHDSAADNAEGGHEEVDAEEEAFRHLPNRVSEAVRCMTAAAATGDSGSDTSRRHLSLVCTASTDASVVIWDVRKVYEAVAQVQQQKQQQQQQRSYLPPLPRHGSLGGTHGGAFLNTTTTAAATVCSDVVTFDCSSPVPGLQNMVVRSSCTVLQVRPLAKLSGGFAGLTSLRWVSSLVSAGGLGSDAATAPQRNVRRDTRIPQIAPCAPMQSATSAAGSVRTVKQVQTRFDKRETERAELEFTEEEMAGMERELAHMLPPLALEPAQALRVNLLVAADCLGTVHVWNLDEELHRYGGDAAGRGGPTADFGWPSDFPANSSSRASARSTSSCSEGRSSASYAMTETSPLATPTRRSTKRKSGGGGVGGGASTRHSGSGGGSHRKAERSGRSRRVVGGLGLAEARENRARMSELTAGSTAAGASPSRFNPQRPSAGRSSCEERGVNPSGASLHESSTTSGRHSTGDATAAPCLTPPRKVPHESHLLRTRRDANASAETSSGPAVTPTKKVKKTRSSLQESSPSHLRTSQHGTSPSRGSQQRPGASCGRPAENHAPTSSASMRPRGSVQRGSSVSSLGNTVSSGMAAGQDLGMPAQPSKCQFRLADGVAITDMVVDLPQHIRTTLRRIRAPSRVTASWQHRPTEAEMDARVLENEFEQLTEEKALFFAFAQLQVYVGVDGVAVSSVRCAPEWGLPDSDGRELFKAAANAAVVARVGSCGTASALTTSTSSSSSSGVEWGREVSFGEPVKLDAFQLRLRRSVLDVHVQPLTHLFLDAWQQRLWVARQDGFVAVLSTLDNALISRMAHPSTDALLPPHGASEWARLQAQFAASVAEESRRGGGGDGFGVECHKESRGLPPSHLTQLLPVARRRQCALMIFATAGDAKVGSEEELESGSGGPDFRRRLSLTEAVHHHQDVSSPLELIAAAATSNKPLSGRSVRSAATASSATSAKLTLAPSSSSPACLSTVAAVEGMSDVKSEFRAREGRQWRWLQELQLCRLDAFAACQAQRRQYFTLCDGISRNVHHVITELGDYAALSTLRSYFQSWRDHRAVYGHTHAMRRQRTARMQRELPLARQLGGFCDMQLRGAYFGRWMEFVAEQRRAKQDTALSCFAAAAAAVSPVQHSHRRHARPLPTAAMMERLHLLSSGRHYLDRWRAWTAEASATRRATTAIMQRFQDEQQPQPQYYRDPPAWSTGGAVPLRRTASSPVSTPPRRPRPGPQRAHEDADMITPYRPIHGVGESFASSLSWSVGERCYPQAEEEEALPLPLTPARFTAAAVEATLLRLPTSVEPFMTSMVELLRARVYVFHFSDARSSTTSVLDESWTVILENAESGADGDSDDDRRFSVFRFALLPLLQGLLSTADDVLPNMFDNSVAEEVLSMLVGIVLAMDYVTAGGDQGQLLSGHDAALAVLRVYAVRAFRTDAEAAEVLRGLAKSNRVLSQFLDFAMERAVMRRMERH